MASLVNLLNRIVEPPIRVVPSNGRRAAPSIKATSKVKLSRSKENNSRLGSGSRGPMPRLNVARQQSAGASSKFKMLPDAATSNMANLKRVKFLDPEFEAPSKQVTKGQLTDEYLRKKSTLDSSLQRVINQTRVAKIPVPKKSKEEIEAER